MPAFELGELDSLAAFGHDLMESPQPRERVGAGLWVNFLPGHGAGNLRVMAAQDENRVRLHEQLEGRISVFEGGTHPEEPLCWQPFH